MRKGDWIQTVSGAKMWPLDPRAEEITLFDIAHSLSMQARFNGHLRQFLSVAEHCCHVSDLLPAPLKLAGLLHDASEAYLCDMPRPLKQHGEFAALYRAAEEALMGIIAEAFRFAYPLPAEVIAVDRALCRTEALQIMGPLHDWEDASEPIPGLVLHCWAPIQARYEFLRRFRVLSAMAEADNWTADEIIKKAG